MKKLIPIMLIFLLCLTAVLADNTITLNYIDEAGLDVDYVTVFVYQCTDSSCSALTGYDTDDRVDYITTGSDNTAVISVPDVSSETHYIAYAFAQTTDTYLPHYDTFYFDGYDFDAGSYDTTLSQKDICRSAIESFSVINSEETHMPVTINVEASLEADTYSAFSFTDDDIYDWGVDHSTYSAWYEADVDVDLLIKRTVELGGRTLVYTVYTDSESLSILADASENVEFSYTPTSEGEYTATVTTHVTDGQCASEELQEASEYFSVIEEGDVAYCYTLVDNLALYDADGAVVTEPAVGEEYTVAVDKVSNAVDEDGALSTLETDFVSHVTNEDGDIDFALSETAPANADTTSYEEYSFAWTPASEGDNEIYVNGIAVDCPYDTNLDEADTLTIYVSGEDIDVDPFVPEITDCSADPIVAVVGEDVEFDVDVSAITYVYELLGDISYSWDFDDGSSSSDKEPTHPYSAIGTYDVVVTATHVDGESDTCNVEVQVIENEDPEVTCDFDGTSGLVGEEIDLSVSASDDGTIESYEWEFGDGENESTSDDSTSHTYESTSDFDGYTVTVTVTDEYGATDTCEGAVTITEPVDVSLRCDLIPTEGIVGEEIALEVEGSIDFTAFVWDFGDGETDETTDDSTTHTYDVANTYIITVEAADDFNSAECSAEIEISEEIIVDEELDIECTFDGTSALVDEEITLDIDVTGDFDMIAWDLNGNGMFDESTFDESITVSYAEANDYLVEATVFTADDRSASCTGLVEIHDLPVENVDPVAVCNGPYEGIVGNSITFDASGSEDTDGTIVEYDWDFGDSTGQITTDETVEYAYTEASEYIVVLTVTDDAGATDSCETTATIVEETVLVCTFDGTTGVTGEELTLEVEISGEYDEILWDLDGDDVTDETTTDESITVIYSVAGDYVVLASVSIDGMLSPGCTGTISIEDDIPAVAVASADPTSGDAKLDVQFSSEGSSGNDPLTYKWSFGDGSGTSTEANPKHTYDNDGTYTAVLLVTDADGDTDTDSVTITVGDHLANNAQDHYYIDGIALSDDGYVRAGDYVELFVSAENIAGIDKTQVAFNAIIQELGVYATSGEFDLTVDDTESAVLYLDIPEDAQEGVYYVRITMSDDDVKRVVYRDIIVTT